MSFSEIEANASDHSEANQKNFNLKPITPEGIFSFACHPGVSCFNRCCHEIDVILTPADILKIKTELNISSDKFLTQYTTMQKLKGTGIPLVKLQMRENTNGACIFLDQKKAAPFTIPDHWFAEVILLALLHLIQDSQKLKRKVSQQKHALSFGKTSAWDTANPKPGRLKNG